jgi:hypothetical protein
MENQAFCRIIGPHQLGLRQRDVMSLAGKIKEDVNSKCRHFAT